MDFEEAAAVVTPDQLKKFRKALRRVLTENDGTCTLSVAMSAANKHREFTQAEIDHMLQVSANSSGVTGVYSMCRS